MRSYASPERIIDDQSPDLVPLQIMEGQDSLRDLASHLEAARSGDRVVLLTMCFDPGDPVASSVTSGLQTAAHEGADVYFGLDAYAFLMHPNFSKPGPLFYPGVLRDRCYASSPFRQRQEALTALNAGENITFNMINQPERAFTNPFAGRSHIKLAVVNDRSYILGPNLDGTDRRDMSIVLDDARTADWLFDIGTRIVKEGGTVKALGEEDLRFQIDSHTYVVLDVGIRGQSAALQEVRYTINESDTWLVSASQYFPDGKVAEWMGRASKGDGTRRPVQVHIGHNDPGDLSLITRTKERIARARQSNCLSRAILHTALPGEFIHTHGLASEQRALGGTFNIVDERGVDYGTAEVVIIRHDEGFARTMGNFILDQVGVLPDCLDTSC
jgi:hypothetical protein